MEHAGQSKVPFTLQSVPVVDSEYVVLRVLESDEINQTATKASNNNQVNGHNEQLQVNMQLKAYAPFKAVASCCNTKQGPTEHQKHHLADVTCQH